MEPTESLYARIGRQAIEIERLSGVRVEYLNFMAIIMSVKAGAAKLEDLTMTPTEGGGTWSYTPSASTVGFAPAVFVHSPSDAPG